MKPITKYAKSGNINIAYQVVGEHPVDLVYIPGWVSNIDMLWIDPRISGFLTRLTKFSRLILFDKRGTGLSDRVSALCTLEERIDDIRSVMDAAGSRKAIMFGHSEGGTVSLLFAATYPQRTLALITFGIFAKRKYSPDYPWAPKTEERSVFYNTIKKHWGNGQKMGLEWLMPSMIRDVNYYDWFAGYLRSAASPGAALALAQMNSEADVRHILHTISAPALILHRTGDRDVHVEEGKYLAERIRNAKFVQLQGIDHLFWVGETYQILAEIEGFITGVRPFRIEQDWPDTVVALSPKIDIENMMLTNFKYPLKIAEFAVLAGRSLSTFKRDFKKLYGITPASWLKNKRLEYAKKLLCVSDLNVGEICHETGFKNESHFIREFKKKYNLSPNRYKNKFSVNTSAR